MTSMERQIVQKSNGVALVNVGARITSKKRQSAQKSNGVALVNVGDKLRLRNAKASKSQMVSLSLM